MKEIVILRHGEKSGDQLTPEGIVACEALAQRIGRFNTATSSDTNRTAMTAELLAAMPAQRDSRVNVPIFPAEARAALLDAQANHPLGIVGGIWQSDVLIQCAREAGERLLDLTNEVLRSLPDGERALIVSHDGTMAAFEKLLTHEPFATIDHSFGPLEGLTVNDQLQARRFV